MANSNVQGTAALSIEGVCKTYQRLPLWGSRRNASAAQGKQALCNVSLRVEPGETIGLLGANVLSAVLIFLLTVVCFAGVGMMWAGIVMVVKRVAPIIAVAGYLVVLLSGVLFPVTLLPRWLQTVGELVPLTHALDGMRFALLKGYGLYDLSLILLKLMVFAVVFVSLGMVLFNAAVRIAKRTGSLVEYLSQRVRTTASRTKRQTVVSS